ncbi:MAG: RNA polymerase sigma factor [Pseudonocardia sp.]
MRTHLVADVADVSASSGRPGRRPRGGASANRALDPPDELLVKRVGAGDQGAIEQIYDRYCRPAYSLARRICVDDGIAEDVVQEAFLALWRDPQRFDPNRGRFGSWLLTLVHHKAVDAVRRESATRRRTVPAADGGEEWNGPPGPGADQAAIGSVVAGQVRDALGRLPDEQREALALAYYGGYTQREVAAITGVPIGTVKSRMFTGVQRLRRLLMPLQLDAEMLGNVR